MAEIDCCQGREHDITDPACQYYLPRRYRSYPPRSGLIEIVFFCCIAMLAIFIFGLYFITAHL